jgi:parvulin-like peptidyl-prolyl isomerase
MKRTVLAAGAAALVLAATAPAAELVERIVARVNDRLITQTEFDKRISMAQKVGRTGDSPEVRIVILEDMIREKLLDERAKEMAVTATDEEVNAAVQRVKTQYNLSTDAEFEAALAQNGMSKDDLMNQMRDTITLQKVIGRDVTSRMDLSDDALRLEYERKKEELYPLPESAHVYEIVRKFSPDDAEARQQAVAKIEEIQGKVKAGTPFADLAGEDSEGATKDKGGDLGVVSKGELVEVLDTAIFSSKDEYPAPALTANSIHFLRVTDRKPAGYKPFADVKEDLKKQISDDLYQKRFTEYLDKLRRDAYVKIYDPDLAALDQAKSAKS